jgi:ketosteroid isomerase-like protein
MAAGDDCGGAAAGKDRHGPRRSMPMTTMDETALFTVKDGKIVREEFFYVTG